MNCINQYTTIPCDCGQNKIIFFRGTLNCMDVLYCPTPIVKCNITHSCNSMYRGKMFLYIDQSHGIFAMLYFNSKIINQNYIMLQLIY